MDSPEAWPPYAASRDCSFGFCSMYCPQWCYFYFPPPPPRPSSALTLSPLLIAIIIIVSSAFLIVTGYLAALKYCATRRRPLLASPRSVAPTTWLPPPSAGLDISVINKLSTYHYRRGHGPVAEAERDCSVCLGEFRDGDSLRLLPKCAHAFHRSCIDTWLASHSNCPLCRAGVVAPAEHTVTEMVGGGDFTRILGSESERGSPEARSEGEEVAVDITVERDEVMAAAESSAGRSAAVKRSFPGVVPL